MKIDHWICRSCGQGHHLPVSQDSSECCLVEIARLIVKGVLPMSATEEIIEIKEIRHL